MSTGRSFGRLLLGLVAWCLAGAVAPAEEARPTLAPDASPPAGEPAVWAVRDHDSTLYLFGTIHLRRPGAPWGGPTARRALDEAGTVWLEVSPDDLSPEKAGRLLQAIGFDPARPLRQRLDPERLRQVRETARSLGVPWPAIETMKPWLLSSVLALGPMNRAGYTPESGVDRMVAEAATGAGKAIRALETGEQQLRYLDGLPESEQLAMLYEALDLQADSVGMLQTAEAAWETGDEAGLRALLIEPMAQNYPDLHEAIIDRRNHRWAETLAEVMAGSGVDFVAIGAGHLGGERSVDALLAARGYRVERLTPAPP
ncbi:MAG TPA: TraB/GumN family protein [Geminicoccaceae bacterium]|nr:TraB/GumN family protein [Geminicoccus sp.]HMU49355.1 TraB/GumN family protein [Geminicoccaceae bacterium]